MAAEAAQQRDAAAALFTTGDYENSLAKFAGALALITTLKGAELEEAKATRVSCLLNSASCCIKLSKWKEAVDYSTEVLNDDKKNAKALFRRGQARRQLKEFSRARIDLVMASELKDDEAIREELRLLRQEQDTAPKSSSAGAAPMRFPQGGFQGGSAGGFGGASQEELMAQLAALQARQAPAASAAPTSKPFEPASLTGAAKELHDKAESGDAAAQIEVAEALEEGKKGFPKNPKSSFEYYKKAADSGNANGQNCLAWCMKTGFGTVKDEAKAVELYKLCAAQGHTLGQANLGFCFDKGIGAAENLDEAARWYTAAAEGGSSVAQVNLALMYEKGRGVPQDCPKSLELYKMAAAQGNPNANINVGLCYEKGTSGVAKDMTVAFQYYMKAAEGGDHTGQAIIGSCFENGEGVAVDIEKAKQWYTRSAMQGNGHAENGLKRIMEKKK